MSSRSQGVAYRAAPDPKRTSDPADEIPQRGHFNFSYMLCMNIEISLTLLNRTLTASFENLIGINNRGN